MTPYRRPPAEALFVHRVHRRFSFPLGTGPISLPAPVPRRYAAPPPLRAPPDGGRTAYCRRLPPARLFVEASVLDVSAHLAGGNANEQQREADRSDLTWSDGRSAPIVMFGYRYPSYLRIRERSRRIQLKLA
jgi:hypothetical protein